MYAEHVLKKAVDWSTLRSNERFGHLGDALSVRTPVHIPDSPVPEWFAKNPELYDEPGQPLPLDREPRPARWRPPGNREFEAMDMTIQEAFDAMDMEAAT